MSLETAVRHVFKDQEPVILVCTVAQQIHQVWGVEPAQQIHLSICNQIQWNSDNVRGMRLIKFRQLDFKVAATDLALNIHYSY